MEQSDGGFFVVNTYERIWEMNTTIPRLMTIRQIAATGLMPEHALRTLVKTGRAPSFKVGNKNLINYDKLLQQLQAL